MGAKSRKLKKQSDTNTTQLNSVTFFLDRCIEMHTLSKALLKAGCQLEVHSKHFVPDEQDQVWLKEVSNSNWVVITRDENIYQRPFERDSLYNTGGRAFIVCAGNLTSDKLSDLLVTVLPKMLRFLIGNSAPFIAKIYKSGQIKKLEKK